MSMTNCHVCGVSVFDKSIFRSNPKGEEGIGICKDCMTEEQRNNIDPIVNNIARIIEEDNANSE